MARFLYRPNIEKIAKQTFGADISNPAVDIRLICVNATGAGTLYTPNQTHEFLSSIPAGARIAVSTALQNKLFTNGKFTADPIDINSVTGDEFEAVVVYRHTGTDATSELLAYLDSGSGLPFTPSGGKVTITPDPTNGFFHLAPDPV